MLEEIDAAFQAWNVCSGVKFVRADSVEGALVKVTFEDLSGSNPHRCDLQGGNLSQGSADSIKLDVSERWCLASGVSKGAQPASTVPAFKLLPVMLHQVGHMLGMRHSDQNTSIMFPFYDGGDRCALVTEDWEKCGEMYAVEGEPWVTHEEKEEEDDED